MRTLLLAVSVALAGCAARTAAPPPAPPPIDLAPADGLVRAGCYRCLLMAFDTYDRARASDPAPPDARSKAFSTALLLAVREKEIGLAATPWIERAALLAEPDETAAIDLVRRLPWTSAGTADFEPLRPSSGTDPNAWELPPLPAHPLLHDYLTAAAACSLGTRTLDPVMEASLDLDAPIVRYRVGLCGAAHRQRLEAVATADARFVEAWFAIGRYEMSRGVSLTGTAAASREWLTSAVQPLVTAHEGILESPVIAVVLAGLMRARGELARALGLYNWALALRPGQRDALLGRIVTLTYLERHATAVETATELIELRTAHVGEAYYWRAWNNYQLTNIDEAGADIASARRLLVNADVMLVSGMIAIEQQRPANARRDFEGSLRMDNRKCAAHWYLGFLDVEEERWPGAVQSFATAAGCYADTAEQLRAELGLLPPDLPEEARRQQTASYDRNIADNIVQTGRSFFNAAQASMRQNDTESARRYAQSALAFDAVRERAQALLTQLDRPAH